MSMPVLWGLMTIYPTLPTHLPPIHHSPLPELMITAGHRTKSKLRNVQPKSPISGQMLMYFFKCPNTFSIVIISSDFTHLPIYVHVRTCTCLHVHTTIPPTHPPTHPSIHPPPTHPPTHPPFPRTWA